MSGGSYYVYSTDEDDGTSSFKCQILLLDGTKEIFTISKKAVGQCLFDLVFDSLNLVEKDYFGLQYKDSHPTSGKYNKWLIGSKLLKKQLVGLQPFQLQLRIRYYPANIDKIKNYYTKYLLYLQLKKDIYEEKLHCTKDIAIILSSYALQADYGDYKTIMATNPNYVTQFKFIKHQSLEIEKEMEKAHESRSQMSSENAESEFIYLTSKLPYYGVDVYNALTVGKELVHIGPSAAGFNVFQNRKRVHLFAWTSIYKISFKKKRISIQVKNNMYLQSNGSAHPTPRKEPLSSLKSGDHNMEINSVSSSNTQLCQRYIYMLSSLPICKTLWQNCVDCHVFFRMNNLPGNNNSVVKTNSSSNVSKNSSYRVISNSIFNNYHNNNSDAIVLNDKGSATPAVNHGSRTTRIIAAPFLDDMHNWSKNTRRSIKRFISNRQQSVSKFNTKTSSNNNADIPNNNNNNSHNDNSTKTLATNDTHSNCVSNANNIRNSTDDEYGNDFCQYDDNFDYYDDEMNINYGEMDDDDEDGDDDDDDDDGNYDNTCMCSCRQRLDDEEHQVGVGDYKSSSNNTKMDDYNCRTGSFSTISSHNNQYLKLPCNVTSTSQNTSTTSHQSKSVSSLPVNNYNQLHRHPQHHHHHHQCSRTDNHKTNNEANMKAAINNRRIFAKFDSDSSDGDYDNNLMSRNVNSNKGEPISRSIYCTSAKPNITPSTHKDSSKVFCNAENYQKYYCSANGNIKSSRLDRLRHNNKSFDESYDEPVINSTEIKSNPSLESLPDMIMSVSRDKHYYNSIGSTTTNDPCRSGSGSTFNTKSTNVSIHLHNGYYHSSNNDYNNNNDKNDPGVGSIDRFRSSSIGPGLLKQSNAINYKSKSNVDLIRNHANKEDQTDLVNITLYPDRNGVYGFTVKGGVDLGTPVTIYNIAPNSSAETSYPRLHMGDQIVAINSNTDLANSKQEEVVALVKKCSASADGELRITIRPSNYLVEYKPEQTRTMGRPSNSTRNDSDSNIGFTNTFGVCTKRFNSAILYNNNKQHRRGEIVNTDFKSQAPSATKPLENAVVKSMKLLEIGLSNDELLRQFEMIYRLKPGLTMNDAKKAENFVKNRYRDISPYDQTRVILKGQSDYINASIVNMQISSSSMPTNPHNSYSHTNRYIAAQGPLSHTVPDFWQMCWEQGSRLVVMVTSLAEGGRPKCHRYWPILYETEEVTIHYTSSKHSASDDNDDDHDNDGDRNVSHHRHGGSDDGDDKSETLVLHVTCLSEERCSGGGNGTIQNGKSSNVCATPASTSLMGKSGWTERDFVLYCPRTGEERRIKQLQYDGWPDHGVPPFHSEFVRFVTRVRDYRGNYLEPIIVHCSAGIGRTGVLITMETAMCLLEAGLPVDPIDLLKKMRDQRASMIQTHAQFIFVCEAIFKVYKEMIRL